MNEFEAYQRTTDYSELVYTPLYIHLQNLANEVNRRYSDCREKSLVITKLEEASMWAERMHYSDQKTVTIHPDSNTEA